jgi:hypothetical protein
MSTTFTIADDCDPDGDISPNANPVEECLTYMSHVAHGAVGNMGFSAADFENLPRRIAANRSGKNIHNLDR